MLAPSDPLTRASGVDVALGVGVSVVVSLGLGVIVNKTNVGEGVEVSVGVWVTVGVKVAGSGVLVKVAGRVGRASCALASDGAVAVGGMNSVGIASSAVGVLVTGPQETKTKMKMIGIIHLRNKTI